MNVPDLQWLPKLEGVSLSPDLISLAATAMARAKPGDWGAVAAKGGLVRGANLSENLRGLVLLAPIKPPAFRTAVISLNDRRVFLPGDRSGDLLSVCGELNRLTLPSAVLMSDFCLHDYGLLEKRCPPVMLTCDADFVSIGVDPASAPRARSAIESIWWQRWGGGLSLVIFSDLPGAQQFERRHLGSRVGNFQRLPYGVLR